MLTETPGDFTPKKGSEVRITQKLKTMKEQTLSNTTSGRKGKSRKSKSSVRSRSSTKRKVENKYKVSDTEEPQRMVTTPLDGMCDVTLPDMCGLWPYIFRAKALFCTALLHMRTFPMYRNLGH